MKRDMKAAEIQDNSWYDEALHTEKRYEAYNQGLSEYQLTQQQQMNSGPREVECDVVAGVSGVSIIRPDTSVSRRVQ